MATSEDEMVVDEAAPPDSVPVSDLTFRHIELHWAIKYQRDELISKLINQGETPCMEECFKLAVDVDTPWPLFKVLLNAEPGGVRVPLKCGLPLLKVFCYDADAITSLLNLGVEYGSLSDALLFWAFQNPKTTLEAITTMIKAGFNFQHGIIPGETSLNALFRLEERIEYNKLIEFAKLLMDFGVNPFDLDIHNSARNAAVKIATDSISKWDVITCSEDYQFKILKWLAFLEFMFEHPLAKYSDPETVNLEGAREELSKACCVFIRRWQCGRTWPASYLHFILGMGYIRERVVVNPTPADLLLIMSNECGNLTPRLIAGLLSLCVHDPRHVLYPYFPYEVWNKDTFMERLNRAKVAINLMLKHDPSLLRAINDITPLTELILSKRLVLIIQKFENYGLTFIANNENDIIPKYNYHDSVLLLVSYLIDELGVHVGHASPHRIRFRSSSNLKDYSEDTLELFNRVNQQLGLPNAIYAAIFKDNLLCLRKLLPYCPAPPMALLIISLLKSTPMKNWAIFGVLAEFGPVPPGSEMYRAIMSINTLPRPLKGKLEEMHSSIMSLRDLSRIQARLWLGKLAAQPGQPSLPELINQKLPPGLRDCMLITPKEPLNIVRCDDKEALFARI